MAVSLAARTTRRRPVDFDPQRIVAEFKFVAAVAPAD
jgi:hypothetical protein